MKIEDQAAKPLEFFKEKCIPLVVRCGHFQKSFPLDCTTKRRHDTAVIELRPRSSRRLAGTV